MSDMVSDMRTTLNNSDSVMRALKREAAATGRTMTELVESALRTMLARRADSVDLPELPTFDGGRSRVDVANRDAFYEVIQGR